MREEIRPRLVSVVTPSFNQGRFIAETIESVISQEGGFLLEYLIMDGGSTDNSVEVIKRYEGLLKEGRWPVKCRGIEYRWVSEKDRGQADALDKGFKASKGEVLGWLNSDDIYLPGAIEKAVDFLVKNPAFGMVYGKGYNVGEDGRVLEICPTGGFDVDRLAVTNFISQPSAFFTRKAYVEAGGVDTALHYTLDFDLWVRIARLFRVGYMDEFLSSARLHPEAKTVAERHALKCQEELIRTVLKYWGWAPANHVFGYCHELLKSKAPRFARALPGSRFAMVFCSLPISLVYYMWLNKGIRLKDLKMLTFSKIKSIFAGWKGSRDALREGDRR